MSVRKDFFWNTTAGVINASEAVIMAMVTTRLGTIEDAGILTISFAVGNLMMTVGKIGARVFHATDIEKAFSYITYILERLISVCGMALITAIYVFVQKDFGGWTDRKLITAILICLIYLVESIEDCIWGELQRNGFLYVGGRMFVARWIGILVSFITIMVVTGDIVISLSSSFIISVFIFLICVLVIRQNNYLYEAKGSSFEESRGNVFRLIRQTIPFFVASFCVFYINNAPKFAIDRTLTDKEQACFGFVAMPVFVIGLVNQFVYQPYLVLMSEEWNGRRISSFRVRIRRQMIILAGIGVACIFGAALIGIPVLSTIYSMDLTGYWRELVVLQIAGLFLALSGYFAVILTTMREGNKLLLVYLISVVLSFVIMGMITSTYGTLGASVGYMLIMMALCLAFLIEYATIIKKESLTNGQMV